MDTFQQVIATGVEYFFRVRDFFAGILVPALPWLYALATLAIAFFLWGIIYSIIRSGYHTKKLDEWSNFTMVGNVERRRQLRLWRRIVHDLKSADPAAWKNAILQADFILDEIIKRSGYRGKNATERFQQLTPAAIPNYEKIAAAHQVADRIRKEPTSQLSRAEAVEVLKVYQRTFQEMGLLT